MTMANSRGGGARRGRWTEACAGWTRLKEDEVSGKAWAYGLGGEVEKRWEGR